MVGKEEKVKNFVDFIVSEVTKGRSIPFKRVTRFASEMEIDRVVLIDDIVSELEKRSAAGRHPEELKQELKRAKEIAIQKRAVKKREPMTPQVKNFVEFIVSEVVKGKPVPFKRVTRFASQMNVDKLQLIDAMISELESRAASGRHPEEMKKELERAKKIAIQKRGVKKREPMPPQPSYDPRLAKELRRVHMFMRLVEKGMTPNEAASTSYLRVYGPKGSVEAVKPEKKVRKRGRRG